MARGVEQAEAFVLAVDVGEQRAGFFQQACADGLVVEEGAGGAALADHAAENERLIRIALDVARKGRRGPGDRARRRMMR